MFCSAKAVVEVGVFVGDVSHTAGLLFQLAVLRSKWSNISMTLGLLTKSTTAPALPEKKGTTQYIGY